MARQTFFSERVINNRAK